MSFGTSSICALCTCQPSISLCEGCQRKFCLPCLSQHRHQLSLELDDLVNRRNELVEMINNQKHGNVTDRASCIDEINRWQNDMHKNIDRIASIARDNVQQYLSEASKNVRVEIDRISQDLQQKQKTGGYVEGDLNRIKQQLTELNDRVQRFNEQIRIDTSYSKKIDWDSLLFVKSTKETHPVAASSLNNNNSYSQNNNNSYSQNNNNTYYQNNNNSYSQNNNNSYSQNNNNSYSQTNHNTYYPNNNFNSRQNVTMPASQSQRHHPSISTHTSLQHPMDTPRSSFGRSASVSSTSSRPSSYQCVGCKTVNNINENGPNVCSTCRFPARI